MLKNQDRAYGTYNIYDAPLISYEQSILYTQKQKTLDRDEKIKLQKYFMCHKLGLDFYLF